MYYKKNVYYNPESYGLEVLGTVDLAEPDYSFDMLAVFREVEKPDNYYLATDSGCSCPTPFEDYSDVGSLTGPLTRAQMIEEALSLWGESGCYEPEKIEELLESS